MNILIKAYIAVAIITMIVDTTTLYNAQFPLWRAIIIGLFDGIIWPIRIGWDIIAYAIYYIKEWTRR